MGYVGADVDGTTVQQGKVFPEILPAAAIGWQHAENTAVHAQGAFKLVRMHWRKAKPALAGDHGRDALIDGVGLLTVLHEVELSVRMRVDEARRDGPAGSVEAFDVRQRGKIADAGDGVAADK